MRHRLFFAVKTCLVLLIATILLVCGFAFLPSMSESTKTFAAEEYAPEISIPETDIPAVPETQTQLEGQFGMYSFVSQEDGKSVVSIYSNAQIRDFNKRRNDGEWFSISSEQALFLVSDTLELLEKYDIVRVQHLDRTVSTFFGDSMYTKNELDTDKRRSDIIDLIFARIAVLNSASYNTDENIWFFYTNTGNGTECKDNPPYELSVENLKAFPFSDTHDTQKELAKYPPYGVFAVAKKVSWHGSPALFFAQSIKQPILQHMHEIYPEPTEITE